MAEEDEGGEENVSLRVKPFMFEPLAPADKHGNQHDGGCNDIIC